MISALALLTKIPLWVYPAAALVAWGGCSNYRATQAKAKLEKAQAQSAESRAQELERNRVTEQALVAGAGKVVNELSKAQQAAAANARAADARLRATAAAWAASSPAGAAPAACGSDGAPAVAVLPDETRRDLVFLAEEAEQVRLRLLACQGVLQSNYEEMKRGSR